jgi:glucokinase
MKTALLLDAGGTNLRFALAGAEGGTYAARSFKTSEYSGLEQVMTKYLRDTGAQPDTAAFAIAGPIGGDSVTMTNLGWSFSPKQLQEKLKLDTLHLLNDFEGIAHGVPLLKANQDYYQVGGGKAEPNMPMVVIGPGTGLGAAGIVPDGKGGFRPIAGEGGHATMAATDGRDEWILSDLRREFGHVSAERVVSGPGLVNIYNAIVRTGRLDLDQKDPATAAAEISTTALKGDPSAIKTRVSGQALDQMCHFLGSAAGNLALSYGAQGGVYIAGGIVPKLGREYFEKSSFRESFEAKGRFNGYQSKIPTYVITHENPALEGLRKVAQMRI